jgi:hypothetical protein
MSKTRYGVIVLTPQLEAAGRDRASLDALGGERIDETDGSVTLAFADEAMATGAVTTLVDAGLVEGEGVFYVAVPIPTWLDEYKDLASSMQEHGG